MGTNQPLVSNQGVEEPIISHIRLTPSVPSDGRRNAEDVLREFAGFHTAGNFEGAALLAQELINIAPNHPEGHYNLACALARLRRTEQALAALEQSVADGCRWIEHLRVDPDLDSLRGEARFAMLLAHVEQLIADEQPSVGPLRNDEVARVIEDVSAAAPGLLSRYHVPAATVCLIENGAVAWSGEFRDSAGAEDTIPALNNSLCQLRRPMELLALIAAAQQEQAGQLNLASLLGQADEIGLRELPGRRTRTTSAQGAAGNRAALVSMTPPATLKQDSPAARDIDWAGADAIPGTVELIVLAIELTSDKSFANYCDHKIFEPSGTAHSELVNNRKTRAKSKVQKETAESLQRIVGHTRLGTPIISGEEPDGLHVQTTAADLALIIASLMNSQSPLGSSSLERIAASAKLSPGGLGLAIDINRTADGVRMQMAETVNGMGMLARWYPQTGRGVVIVFNSENGPDAAVRLAQIALGGS